MEDGTVLAMKLHRLGRVSFMAVKAKRDYHKRCTSHSWLSLSSLAARKEFLFMKALEHHGFAVTCAIDRNRHCYASCIILKHVPNSALWLLRFPAAGEMRLRASVCLTKT